jgi:hypothetical protein
MKRKEIFLVVILILFGLLVQVYESGETAILEGCSVDYRSLQDRQYPHDIVLEDMRFENIKNLEIKNPAGEIRVFPSSENAVVIRVVKRIFHKQEKEVAGIEKGILIDVKAVDPALSIGVDSQGKFPYSRARILFNISVPRSLGLKLFNRYGDVVIEGIGGDIYLDEKYGNLKASDIHSDFHIIHGYGKVMINSVQGRLEMDTRYSTATILNARGIEIRGRHAKIELEGIKGDVVVADSHEKIVLRDVKGRININGRHCPMVLRNIDSDYLLIKNSYHDVIVENLWAEEVDLSVDKGDLLLRYFDVKKQINIRNTYSNITMVYAGSMNPLFNISLTYGKIVNETPRDLNMFSGKIKKVYTGGNGLPKILITNRYGDILLKNPKVNSEE